jgi:hypothetical protein
MFKGEFFHTTSGAAGFYDHQIQQSVRFDSASSSYLSKAQGTPTNVQKCTVSFWIKRGKIGSGMYGMIGSGGGGYSFTWNTFGGDNDADTFYFLQHQNNVTNTRLESNALFRDTGGWLNVVMAHDSTQSTAADRNKIYFNGTQYTDWGNYNTYSTQNCDILLNTSGQNIFVGSSGDTGGAAYNFFDGYIAEFVFIDGQQLAPTSFAEEKNSVWIPKDPSGLTFGNNGAYLKFENSGDLGNDSSGNNNDYTATNMGADHQVLDSPTFGS